YECKHADRAVPPGDAAEQLQMPWLSVTSPQGKGLLPGADVREGGNQSAPGVIYPSGDWEFVDNKCIFYFTPDMALYDKQRFYVLVWARNPVRPMPRDDPENVWQVIFNASGDWGLPVDHQVPCMPYFPPYCNETGEAYFVNPVSFPSNRRHFELLYPNYTDTHTESGPYDFAVPEGEDQYFVTNYAVLGVLTQPIYQPQNIVLGARTVVQLWFVAELGANRGGQVGVHAPNGFEFGQICSARNLPDEYYASFGPPAQDAPQRVWQLEDMGDCHLGAAPSWHPSGVYALIKVAGSIIQNRLYGFEMDVIVP
ncbi:unnamed protein product, partial [Symbiodinium sp. CCMP2456]